MAANPWTRPNARLLAGFAGSQLPRALRARGCVQQYVVAARTEKSIFRNDMFFDHGLPSRTSGSRGTKFMWLRISGFWTF